MLLSEIFRNIDFSCRFFRDCEIEDIAYDSRKAGDNILFVALTGAFADGHSYVKSAYDKGSRVFLCEREVDLPADAVVLIVKNSRQTLAFISAEFFSHPEKQLTTIGVTGTKGKTSVTHMIRTVLDECGVKSGVIGTVGAYFGDEYVETVNTTPESYEIFKLMRRMVSAGCKAVAMEVSSLGIQHHRVDGINFDVAVFTNFSPDHIGGKEHKTLEEYRYWKKQLFFRCNFALLNADDDFTREIISDISCPYKTFSAEGKGDYNAENIENVRDSSFLGIAFDCVYGGETYPVTLHTFGRFNAYNALATFAVCDKIGIDKNEAAKKMIHAVCKGRGELVPVPADFSVIIDYAHNGLSIRNVISSVREYEHNRIITLFGSVGDRAQLRRRELGEVSGRLSDHTIITTDDPGFEDPLKIAEEIASYVEKENGSYEIIVDREQAVFRALSMAEPGDIILLLGKGSETAQKVKGQKVPYSDSEAVRKFFNV